MHTSTVGRSWCLVLTFVSLCGVSVASRVSAGQTPSASSPAGRLPTTPQQPASTPQDPTQGTATAPLDGATLFTEKGCAYCHGPMAAGSEKGPTLQGVGKKLKRGAIEHQVEFGGGGMPAFGEALARPEIDELVRYLLTLKKPATRPRATTKPTSSFASITSGAGVVTQ